MAAALNDARVWHAPWAMLPDGWRENVRFILDDAGYIRRVESGAAPAGAGRLPGPVIPGMVNVHSHAHQRLIAGLTSRPGRGRDSFWSWRDAMYRALGLLDAQALETIAAWLYMELLEGGYTTTGEFHYLHRGGNDGPVAMSRALINAAGQAGSALTLLPVWYRYGGFGRRRAGPEQQRFHLDLDGYLELVEQVAGACAASDLTRWGLAPHSLRAVDASDLTAAVDRYPEAPVHIHIAEQVGEVDACREHYGAEPIAVLAGSVRLGPRWCLIHATHARREDLHTIAAAGSVVGLCPTTEADLGDGLFAAREYLESGGRMAIGSDSNLVTCAAAELRLLEWSQRYRGLERNLLQDGQTGVGEYLWRHTAAAGASALDQPAGELAVGRRADWVVLDPHHPLIDGVVSGRWLDVHVFTGAAGLIDEVWVAGQRKVRCGRHPARDELATEFVRLRRRLMECL